MTVGVVAQATEKVLKGILVLLSVFEVENDILQETLLLLRRVR